MQKGLLLRLAGVFMISAADLLSAGSSFAGERVCEELAGLRSSPPGVVEMGRGGVLGGNFGGVGWDENHPGHV